MPPSLSCPLQASEDLERVCPVQKVINLVDSKFVLFYFRPRDRFICLF
jgi:hypothetical protein